LMEKLIRHQQADPIPVESLNPNVPAELADIVRRMMAKRPEDRYRTPAGMAVAVKPFCRTPNTGASVPRPAVRSAPAAEQTHHQEDTPIHNILGDSGSLMIGDSRTVG